MKVQIPFFFFIIFFLSIHGLLHYYFYTKIKIALKPGPQYNVTIVFFLFLMFIAPLLLQIVIRSSKYLLSTSLSYVAYTWMAGLFLFLSIHLAFDLYKAVITFLSFHFSSHLFKFKLTDQSAFTLSILIVTASLSYGFIEAQKIRVKRVTITTEKLPAKTGSLKVVQLSDVHFSAINGIKLARKITEIIRKESPDIIVSTGDLVDRGFKEEKPVEDLFRSLEACYGKYAVTGNHEFYGDLNKALAFTRRAGFKILRNKGIIAGGIVNVIGVDDPTVENFQSAAPPSENDILKKFQDGKLVILLKHQPRVKKESTGMFDLQLSGHTHNGQIFPFRLITSLFFPYNNGLYALENHGSFLYVSSGTGTWGPPVRFLAPPEIVSIEFKRKTALSSSD